MESFEKFEFLWKEDPHDKVKEFLGKDPDLDEFEARIKKYYQISEEAERLPELFHLGCLQLNAGPVVAAIKNEAAEWKQVFGTAMNEKIKGDVQALVHYMDETSSRLHRDVGSRHVLWGVVA